MFRVLIADDDLISCKLLGSLLTKWGFEIDVVNNGVDALRELLQPDGPQLAILDWMMPGLDGTEVIKKLRANHRESYTYVLLLTAKGQKEDVLEGMDAGADDYLKKPFDAKELQARLRVGTRILALERDEKRAEDALRQSELQYRLLFDSNPLPMWVFDRSTLRFLTVNEAAVRHYGFSRLEFLAMTADGHKARGRHPCFFEDRCEPGSGPSRPHNLEASKKRRHDHRSRDRCT